MASDKKIEVKAIVYVEEEQVAYKSLKISQVMGDHHDFEVLLDHKTFDTMFFDSPEKKLKMAHSKVTIDLLNDDANVYTFVGLVTNVRMIAEDGMHGGVLLVGKSTTIELEKKRMMQSFSNTNLKLILDEITSGTLNLKTDIEPDWKFDIDFSIMYNESEWSYFRRTCNRFQEKYFYSGEFLVVGSHPEWPVTPLKYDVELRTLEVGSRLIPNQFSNYYYKREEHTTFKQDSPADIDGATDWLQQVGKRSDRLTMSRKPNVPSAAAVPDMAGLIEIAKRQKVANGGEMLYIRGECKICKILIGRLIQVDLPANMGGSDVGLYRVCKVVHSLDDSGFYKSEFEAIPADLKYFPTPEVPVPTPFPIEVEIYDNNDPKGQGRVQIIFPFDTKPCSTWIPVMSYDAGGDPKGVVKTNRGSIFLPEIGDSALAFFLDGQQLSQPFIMGSMFHGNNADNQGGGKGNHVKTITDKSGSYMMMNTKEGSMKLFSKKGSSTVLLDGQGNISISTPATITMSAKDIKLNASNSISMSAKPGDNGGDGFITVYAEKNIDITAQNEGILVQAKTENITLKAKTDFSASSEDADLKLQAAKEVKMEGEDIKVDASSTIKISSSDTDII
ncbi:MAG: phage baseplate assembly protein V [Tannerella sp.]|jgi:uncharacterized protein involved in type VI secretion and phage assembly|nr:phage baseplate assembly protein V [Tannerella sp.]